jgi:hypothetical protein
MLIMFQLPTVTRTLYIVILAVMILWQNKHAHSFIFHNPFLICVTACLVKEQQKSNFIVFAFIRQGLYIFQLIDIEKKHNVYE